MGPRRILKTFDKNSPNLHSLYQVKKHLKSCMLYLLAIVFLFKYNFPTYKQVIFLTSFPKFQNLKCWYPLIILTKNKAGEIKHSLHGGLLVYSEGASRRNKLFSNVKPVPDTCTTHSYINQANGANPDEPKSITTSGTDICLKMRSQTDSIILSEGVMNFSVWVIGIFKFKAKTRC